MHFKNDVIVLSWNVDTVFAIDVYIFFKIFWLNGKSSTIIKQWDANIFKWKHFHHSRIKLLKITHPLVVKNI